MHRWVPGDLFPQQQACQEWGTAALWSWPSWLLLLVLLLASCAASVELITLGKAQVPAVKWIQESIRDFPGGPVVEIPRSHCRGHGFDPWLGN